MLPVICIALVLRLGHATCIDMDVLRPAAAACCDIRLNFSTAWFTVTDECRKGLETCINAEGGHCEHLL